MERNAVLQHTVRFVKDTLSGAEGGHNWWHIFRVWQLAIQIARSEPADLFIVELGSLLHDIADPKFNGGDETVGPRKAREFLASLGVEEEVIAHVEKIVANISFKGVSHTQAFRSTELAVVQDADRLDAMGAIGIARAFNYGGYKGRELFNPHIMPVVHRTKEEYINSTSPTINHFYEKLLLLKDMMNTQTGRFMAEHRHKYMEQFLVEFQEEWQGNV